MTDAMLLKMRMEMTMKMMESGNTDRDDAQNDPQNGAIAK